MPVPVWSACSRKSLGWGDPAGGWSVGRWFLPAQRFHPYGEFFASGSTDTNLQGNPADLGWVGVGGVKQIMGLRNPKSWVLLVASEFSISSTCCAEACSVRCPGWQSSWQLEVCMYLYMCNSFFLCAIHGKFYLTLREKISNRSPLLVKLTQPTSWSQEDLGSATEVLHSNLSRS